MSHDRFYCPILSPYISVINLALELVLISPIKSILSADFIVRLSSALQSLDAYTNVPRMHIQKSSENSATKMYHTAMASECRVLPSMNFCYWCSSSSNNTGQTTGRLSPSEL